MSSFAQRLIVVAYYTGAAGGFTNLLGLRLSGVDGPLGLSNHASAYGDTFVLGTVSAGDALVFFMDVDAGTARYFSDVSLNADGINHAWAAPYAGDAQVCRPAPTSPSKTSPAAGT